MLDIIQKIISTRVVGFENFFATMMGFHVSNPTTHTEQSIRFSKNFHIS